jgi:hypothetical protein
VVEVLNGGTPSAATSSSPTTRDRTITRLTVLKAAANFLGLMGQSREEVRSDHVLLLADKWLAWVEQTDEREEDEQF